MKKQLAPVIHHDAYTVALRKPFLAYFDDVLIKPIEDAANMGLLDVVRNNVAAASPLEVAIRSGRVEYVNGVFRGQFNAEISRELKQMGAKFYARESAWRLPMEQVTLEIRSAIYQARDDSKKAYASILGVLAVMGPNVEQAPTGIDISDEEARVLSDAQRSLVQSAKDVGISIYEGIPPEMERVTRQIAAAAEADAKRALLLEIERLRRAVKKAQDEGASSTALKKTIEASKKRLARRADAIAEHAAAMTLSELREHQYKAMGVQAYKWRTMRDDRVRPGHRELEGKVFTWDSPPVTNPATGERNHPGEDVNCRCVPIPIINIPDL